MKDSMRRLVFLLCVVQGITSVHAASTKYWDSNGTTAGAGATPTGTWGIDSFWNASADGTGTPGAWTAGDTAVFSAGTDAVNAFTVTVSGPPSAGGITVEEGAVTLTGASVGGTPAVSIKGGQLTLNVDSCVLPSSTVTFNGTGVFCQNNPGTPSYGALTFSAGNGELRNIGGSAGLKTMTFSSLTSRAVGVTGLFTSADPATDKIILTGQSQGFKKGFFVGSTAGSGANFAYVDPTAYVRSQDYSATAPGNLDGAGQYWLEDNAGKIDNPASPGGGITHIYKSTGNSASGQSAVGCQSIRLGGGISLGFGSVNYYFDIKAGSILMTGNGTSAQTTTISGSGSISPSSPSLTDPNNELVVRVNFSTDTLVLSCKLGVNGGTGSAFTTDAFALTKCGAGLLTLSGANTYSGITTISQGPLKISSATALGGTGAGTTVISGAQLQTSGALTFAEPLTLNGTGLANDGALLITANGPTFSGPITLGSTGVRLQNNGAAATISGGITGPGFDLYMGGNLGWTVGTAPINIGSGTLTKDGAETTGLRLNTANTIGAINLNNGFLNVGDAGCFGSATITVASGIGGTVNTGGILAGSALGTLNVPNNIVLSAGAKCGLAPAGSGTVLNLAGTISGDGALRRTRIAGTGGGTVMLSGNSSFQGGVVHASDALVLNHKAALGIGTYTIGDTIGYYAASAPIDISANTDLTGANAVANAVSINTNSFTWSGASGLEFSGPVTLTASPTITVSSTAASIISGGISGAGFGITKAGTGTLTFTIANSYSGNTTVNGGTLSLSGSGDNPSSPTISVGSGAALDVSTRSTTLTLGDSQTLSGPGTAGTATLNAAASVGLSMGTSTTLWLPYFSPGTASFNVTGGALTLASGNPVHVVIKNGGAPLSAGDYQLISTGTGGTVAGTAPTSVTLNDTGSDGIAAGHQASLVLNSPGSGLYLHVYNPCTPPSAGAVSPSTQTVCAGGPATFTVTASGTGPFSYQWRKVGSGNVGTDSSSYTINPVATGDAGSYECEVTGQCGSPVTATAGTLAVNTPPASPNTTASTGTGNTLTFDGAKLLAKATGTGLSITAVQTTSAQGGSVSLNAGPPVTISYIAPGSGSSDSFWYTITDGNGCTVSPTINVTLTASNGESPNVVVPATFDSGIFSVTFAGIPGIEYTVQSAPTASGSWSYLKKATAGANGLFEVTDGPYSSPPPSRYYRIVYP